MTKTLGTNCPGLTHTKEAVVIGGFGQSSIGTLPRIHDLLNGLASMATGRLLHFM